MISWEQFEADHPYPEKVGQRELFHFRRLTGVKDWLLEHLFVDGKLHHSSPQSLNDPFECKPHYREPESDDERRLVLAKLYGVLREYGMPDHEAQARIVGCALNPALLSQLLHQTGLDTFAELRMFSFTTSNENLLMWSHYGASHTGVCIEFDASIWPIADARKVKYQTEYPQFAYPPVTDERNMQAALIKSKAWQYEQEFRHIFAPGAEAVPSDGDSLLLHPESIIGLYFGVEVDPRDKNRVLNMVERGPFTPKLYEGVLSPSKFKIEFNEISAD
ncbi:DUF2971 domain-containing protein [Marinobacter sp. LN3S78]|uniref:DUF2971 domain-containing protein n=1 Tax=Marinobacter sp. LN3S78 TaxID=3382300 RepID=UPI00387B1FD2